jgi:hypothetical protein
MSESSDPFEDDFVFDGKEDNTLIGKEGDAAAKGDLRERKSSPVAAKSAEPPANEIRYGLIALFSLVLIQTCTGVAYRASQKSSREYAFSTLSAIVMAEGVKASLAGFLFKREFGAAAGLFGGVTLRVTLAQAGLAFFYAVNNQIAFALYRVADPATIFLFKSAGTITVASMQWVLIGKVFSPVQWILMTIQGSGMAVMQWNECKGIPDYPLSTYTLLIGSAGITGFCSVWNEFLLKKVDLNMHTQNVVLYLWGVFFNLVGFMRSSEEKTFFQGYDGFFPISVVVVNSVIGIIITFAYKFANAVYKMMAGDITAVLLVLISCVAFGYEFRARTALGVAQVLLAVSAFSLIPNATGDALSFPARSTVCCCIALVVGGLAAVVVSYV